MIALLILTFGILAAGQLMYVAMGSNSLSRSKGSAMTVAQDRLESLADLYRRDPANADLTTGDHGPEQVSVSNPNDASIVNRFNVTWNVSAVADPRAGRTLQARQVRVTVTPIQITGTTTNLKSGLNKVVNVTAIFSPALK
jgi:Tfp pilus assembly protein PilV